VSKDKAGKKDKLKHLDLFEMMLNQSQVFRNMVEHFQSAWTPGTHSVLIETGVATPSVGKKQPKAAKAAPVAKPAKARASRKPVAPAKSRPTEVKQSPVKSPGKGKAVSTKPKRVTPRKTAGKVAAASRVAKKK
jgi:hypothetical protein